MSLCRTDAGFIFIFIFDLGLIGLDSFGASRLNTRFVRVWI